jgi:8-oxo-dGTP diphosphatase
MDDQQPEEARPLTDRIRVRACGLVMDRSGTHLLIVRLRVPTRDNPIWMPPGGEVEPGESMQAAVQREVEEETGISVSVGSLRSIHEFRQDPFHAVEFYFAARTSFDAQEGVLSTQEIMDDRILESRWISKNNFTNYPLEPSYLNELLQKHWNNLDAMSQQPILHQTQVTNSDTHE